MNTNLTDIENRLWSAADELRANSRLRASDAECEKRVFHAGFGLGIDQIHSLYYIVCPNALTCCWQSFHVRVVRDDAKPIVAAVITLNFRHRFLERGSGT